jgi:uncharacterized membrane protein (UPF0127 family)
MTPMRLINATTGVLIAERVRKIDDPFARMVGLLPKASVDSDEGIWLAHCSAVHTIGMRATIDLIFLDARDCVVGTTVAAVPNRPAFSKRGAKAIVELGTGARLWLLSIGDRLELVLP